MREPTSEEWERIEREELLNDSDRICQAIRAFAKSWPRKFEQDAFKRR